MREKDQGKPLINRFQVTRILETVYYFVLKLIWGCRLTRKITQLVLLVLVQQARLEHLTISVVLKKILMYNLIRIRKIYAESFDNNTAGFYDNIVSSHGMLYYQ